MKGRFCHCCGTTRREASTVRGVTLCVECRETLSETAQREYGNRFAMPVIFDRLWARPAKGVTL